MTAPAAALSLEYIIDQILPTREVHIIGGPSGSGKSSLVFQLLAEAIRTGQPLWGYTTSPVSMCYVSCDRSDASIKRTLKRLKIKDTIPFLNGRKLTYSMEEVVKKARALVPDVKLLFVEAIIRFIPEGKSNDYKIVSDYLMYLTDLCEKYDITLICITHAPKTTEHEGYTNPRQRLSGSVAWGAFSETVILIEPEGEGDRLITVLPRNEAEMTFLYAFDNGVLTETSPEGTVYELLDKHILPLLKPDTLYPRLEILELISQQQIKCNERTIERWIKDKIRVGRIKKVSRGVYQVIPVQ